MPGKDLQDLVRRRLWELARTADDAARLSRWVVPPETLKRMARSGGTSFISESLAEFLGAGELDVTYAGSQTRKIEVTYNINDLPYGANFIDVNPQNVDPRTALKLTKGIRASGSAGGAAVEALAAKAAAKPRRSCSIMRSR